MKIPRFMLAFGPVALLALVSRIKDLWRKK